jgi:hypothetical protein
LGDLGQYINGPEYDTMRRFLSKSLYGESLGRMAHEEQRADDLFQCHDLTPRERAASHLLSVISNHRKIAWFTESDPPNGHQQLPPLTESERAKLNQQTSDAIKAYICFLPKREASALISEWESKLCSMQPYISNLKSDDQLLEERAKPLSPWKAYQVQEIKPMIEIIPQEDIRQSAKQQKAILDLLQEKYGDPKKLPKRQYGKAWVKSEIKKILVPDGRPSKLFSKNSFDKSWGELRSSGQIAELEG